MNIERLKFWMGKDEPHFFHPAVCRTKDGLLMTLQTFDGAGDTYGPVQCCLSTDQGQSWSAIENVEPLRTTVLPSGIREGIADVRPFYHLHTESVIAIGCNTFYGEKKQVLEDANFDKDKYRQYPVYAIRDAAGSWSERKRLFHPFFAEKKNWRVASAQLEILADGDVIIPIYMVDEGVMHGCSVCTVRCTFDGSDLKIIEVGSQVKGNERYAIVEPSVVKFGDKFYLTLRAHDAKAGYIHLATDGCGFWAESDDGLNWSELKTWMRDDGSRLVTSTTQQHWMKLGEKIFLVYTREDESNADVMRWRAPLFAVEFDVENKCLIKRTEEIVLPLMRKDGIASVYGNFHVSSISSEISIVSDAAMWFRIEKGETEAEDRIAEYDSSVCIAIIKQ